MSRISSIFCGDPATVTITRHFPDAVCTTRTGWPWFGAKVCVTFLIWSQIWNVNVSVAPEASSVAKTVTYLVVPSLVDTRLSRSEIIKSSYIGHSLD